MNKAALPLFFVAAECLAHPGHGAPLFHVHQWDWTHWAFWITTVVVAAIAVWRVK